MERESLAHHEHYKQRGEVLVGKFANELVRQYDSNDPRLVIDIIENNKWTGKIIADSHPSFETHYSIALDKVELIHGTNKSRLIFQMGESVIDINGIFRRDVYSPHGLVGYAYGDNLDFYIASFLHRDPLIKENVIQGQAWFDEDVQEYFEKQLKLPGLFEGRYLYPNI